MPNDYFIQFLTLYIID